jgi:hypothetical protein
MARRIYQRAQEAAAAFDEVLTERLVRRQAGLQSRYAVSLDQLMPRTADVRRFPDLVRLVAQQRLKELP